MEYQEETPVKIESGETDGHGGSRARERERRIVGRRTGRGGRGRRDPGTSFVTEPLESRSRN